jgi:hypothetical protein
VSPVTARTTLSCRQPASVAPCTWPEKKATRRRVAPLSDTYVVLIVVSMQRLSQGDEIAKQPVSLCKHLVPSLISI